MAHITFAGMNINYIIDEIQVNKPYNHSTSPYIGAAGSTTKFVSSPGRVITFKNICKHNEQSAHGRKHRIRDYKDLVNKYARKPEVLTSPSKSNIKGNYIITKFDYLEDIGGNYIIDWEFTEVKKFNVTKKTFRVWGKSTSSANKDKKKKAKVKADNGKEINLSSNVKYLLKTCPTLSMNDTHKKCVKSLQKFLQSKGYYKGYKVDGLYQIYTEKAVKGLQKTNKLKPTGKWDKATRSYFQKKYKYPTAAERAAQKAWDTAKKKIGGI